MEKKQFIATPPPPDTSQINLSATSNIYVTKPYLPPINDFFYYINQIYKNCHLTNQGPLLKELEQKLSDFLNVKHFHYVTNGTIAIQLALKALEIEDGEIITTPFSYVATTSSILWERCKPIFVDIEPGNFTIDANKIEAAITPNTKAIIAVHVFGYACNIEKIQNIADKYNLKVIYDSAHAFASKYKGKSLVSYGDISTCSFHATKLFHSVEGGGCVVKDKKVSDKLELIKRFGHDGDIHISPGINGKQSELHAAMGLANFFHLNEIIEKRKTISDLYDAIFDGRLQRPKEQQDLEYNYSYYPVIFKSEQELINVFNTLKEKNIFPRRYFFPSLNCLPYIKDSQSCPISEDISKRIACLPLYPDLEYSDVERIAEIISGVID